MSTATLPPPGAFSVPEPDPEAELYRYAARCGRISSVDTAAAHLGLPADTVQAAAARLVELHLLRPGADGGLVPREPSAAAELVVTPLERAMYERREMADRLRERIDGITRAPAGAAGTLDRVEGVAEIRGLIKLAAEVCRDELVVLHPGEAADDLVDELLDACCSVLGDGVGVRVVCPHRSRAGYAARARLTQLADRGARIRTLSRVPEAAVVFDRSLAVTLDVADLSARRVRDQGMVRFLLGLFDQLWDGATPFSAEDQGYSGEIAHDLQQAIARLMAQGLTDEVVARRLGMSVRTCRRHIAAMLQNLDAVSRFQAGVQAASRFTLA
ncbi:helix-turn-helix transcriptional regulator [Amycolatopsis vancoresmycina]|uniref:LuxR family transcriptional regulator n=1 Tax=Amycolatopsis vancoresmycina DSM 44592 TaxID=1292037 RepID=R1HZ44_9PSEU|nr:helix-turn-helix transcriptional regulator [Amycolatopsis vancoresmycina]EOD63509.1 LuxR family transcriptional regulator [Amycolatopsis vancoresmycina DSM 44592]